VRMPLVLALDTIQGEVEMSERQQKLMAEIIDNLLEELSNAVVKQFGARAADRVGQDDL